MASRRSIFYIFLLFLCCSHLSAQNVAVPTVKTVVIDPGHGGKDPGAVGKNSRYHEKHIVLDISKKIGEKITKAYPDVKVVYTRNNDTFISLSNRVRTVKSNNADLFISVHINSVGAKSPNGASVYILGPRSKTNPNNDTDYFELNQSIVAKENSVVHLDEEDEATMLAYDPTSPTSVIFYTQQWTANFEQSLKLAAEIDQELKESGPFKHGKYSGVKQDIFQVLAYAGKPAVLLELGFMSSDYDYAILTNDAKRDQIAECIFNAFKTYKDSCDDSIDLTKTEENEVAEAEAVETEPRDKSLFPGSKPAEKAVYGLQIMTLGRKLKSNDPSFKGYTVTIVPSGNMYRYIIGGKWTKSEAVSRKQKLSKTFPGCFVVSVNDGKVERVN